MPLIRKVIVNKSSKQITLPASWVEYHKSKSGDFDKVEIEVDGELRVLPHYTKKEV